MSDQKNNNNAVSGTGRVDKAEISWLDELEEDEGLEEPDRDTDFTSIYREDRIDDEEFADTLSEECGEPEEEDIWDNRAAGVDFDRSGAVTTVTGDSPLSPADPASEALMAPPPRPQWQVQSVQETDMEQLPDDWGEEEDDYEEPLQEGESPTWPWGLIAVAVIALVLLMAGGYGVIQQRSATQEEIRRLQSALATSVDPEEVTETREALTEATQRNDQLRASLDALNLENRRLSDTVAGLEAQLQAQREALGQTAATTAETAAPASPAPGPEPEPKAEPEPKPEPEPEPEPVTAAAAGPQAAAAAAVTTVQERPAPAAPEPEPAATSAGKGWFVNFASYGVEATAQGWVDRLSPSAGRTVMTTTTKNGRTFYRVRVVDLPDRAGAEQVAAELAAQHGLPKLWVGRNP